jgi:hypothetical protein
MDFAICPTLAYLKTHFSNIPVFHHSIRCQALNFTLPVFGKAALKKSTDVKAEPCLLFSVINTQYVKGWRNRQGKQTLMHYK